MAFIERTNNRVIAPNSRAVDVAQRAIQEITPVQQRKVYNAFVVQGYPGILYSRKKTGKACTCSAASKTAQSILEDDGTADRGTINKLLSGADFGVDDYGANTWNGVIQRVEDWTSPEDASPYEGVPDIHSNELPVGVDDLMDDFEPADAGFGDWACPVCFGTGWVGGYSIAYGDRHVWGVHQMGMAGETPGELQILEKPWSARTGQLQIVATLPRGATSVTSARLYNKNKPVGYSMTVNGTQVTSDQHLLSLCQGLPVLIELTFTRQQVTHFELQFCTSRESAYMEFPKITKSSDLQFLDLTDPFQILLSPNVPMIRVEDVITDGIYGKAFVVQTVNPWQTKHANQLGWEIQVRVAQPYEVPNLLPRFTRIETKARTTRMVRDNVTGHRRA